MTVEQFAYLKTPDKIRAAIINAGGRPLPLDTIQRRLGTMSRGVIRVDVGEPTESDGHDFRVAGLYVPPPPPKPRQRNRQNNRIAELAETSLKPEKRRTFRYKVTPQYGGTAYASGVIEKVCERLYIPRDALRSDSRQKFLVAARSLVVKLLRERNSAIYSYPRIAEIVGRGDHSTMINAMRKFDLYCEMFPEIAALYLELREGSE